MSATTIEQLQNLLIQQVGAQTDALLTEVKPKVIDVVRAEVMANIEHVIEQRVTDRLTAMRPNAERNAHATLFGALAGSTSANSESNIVIPPQPLTPDMLYDILTHALDPITASLGITKAGKKWACAFCGTKYDNQRGATSHSRKCSKRNEVLTKNNLVPPKRSKPPKAAKNGAAKKKRKSPKRQCIKPGCDTPSKGPRYHHLCAEHLSAPVRHVAAWQRKVRETSSE